MSNNLKRIWLALAVGVPTGLFLAVPAGATGADPIDDAITTTEGRVLGYAGQAVAAVLAVCLIAAGIRVIPKVIRAVAARVTG